MEIASANSYIRSFILLLIHFRVTKRQPLGVAHKLGVDSSFCVSPALMAAGCQRLVLTETRIGEKAIGITDGWEDADEIG